MILKQNSRLPGGALTIMLTCEPSWFISTLDDGIFHAPRNYIGEDYDVLVDIANCDTIL